MASRYSSGLLLSLMIILLALDYSSVKCYQGRERKWKRDSKTGKHVYLQSDPKFILGRKMLQGLEEKLDFPELQAESDRVEAQMFKVKRSHKSRFASGVDDNVVTKTAHYISNKNEKSKEFLEAADEVANLMAKDYKGAGRPKRKPPINNHEPED